MVRVYSPDNLEISLLNLQNILMENPGISAVVILGVNSFYSQVQEEEGVSYSSYIRRLKQVAMEGVGDTR